MMRFNNLGYEQVLSAAAFAAWKLSKTLDSFSPDLMIVYINMDERVRPQLNFLNLLSPSDQACAALEGLMPRFYFDLSSNDVSINDDRGKDFESLNGAYDYAQKLIGKILFHVGEDDADTWKIVISNDEDNTQMIIPLGVSDSMSKRHANLDTNSQINDYASSNASK
jgi:hypothetical protein